MKVSPARKPTVSVEVITSYTYKHVNDEGSVFDMEFYHCKPATTVPQNPGDTNSDPIESDGDEYTLDRIELELDEEGTHAKRLQTEECVVINATDRATEREYHVALSTSDIQALTKTGGMEVKTEKWFELVTDGFMRVNASVGLQTNLVSPSSVEEDSYPEPPSQDGDHDEQDDASQRFHVKMECLMDAGSYLSVAAPVYEFELLQVEQTQLKRAERKFARARRGFKKLKKRYGALHNKVHRESFCFHLFGMALLLFGVVMTSTLSSQTTQLGKGISSSVTGLHNRIETETRLTNQRLNERILEVLSKLGKQVRAMNQKIDKKAADLFFWTDQKVDAHAKWYEKQIRRTEDRMFLNQTMALRRAFAEWKNMTTEPSEQDNATTATAAAE